jgi:hypothetical protein
VRIFWLLLSSVLLAGCDGYMPIRGHLIGASYEYVPSDCTARLQGIPYTDYELDVNADGSFQTAWVVAPKRQKYEIVFSCPGFIDASRSAEYRGGETVELGEVHLTRRNDRD